MPRPTAVWRRCLTGRPFDAFLQNALVRSPSTAAALSLPLTIPLLLLPLHHNSVLLQQQHHPSQQIRHYNIKRRTGKNTQNFAAPISKPIEDPKHPINESIRASECNLVDENGIFHGLQSIPHILRTMDRTRFHLVQVTSGQMSEDGNMLTPPTCRLIPFEAYAKMVQKKTEVSGAERKKLKKLDPRQTVKTLQLSWAITGNDLGHRMKMMKQFLSKGNRVEVMIAGKKGMTLVTRTNMEEVVEGVRAAATEVQAKEWKKEVGVIGKSILLYFEGPLDEKMQQWLEQSKHDEEEDDDDANGKNDNKPEEKEEKDQDGASVPMRLPRRRS